MDLQEANQKMMHQDALSSVGTLNFNQFISSLGSYVPAAAAESVNNNTSVPDEVDSGVDEP